MVPISHDMNEEIRTLLMGLHPRCGRWSPLRFLGLDIIRHIHFVSPCITWGPRQDPSGRGEGRVVSMKMSGETMWEAFHVVIARTPCQSRRFTIVLAVASNQAHLRWRCECDEDNRVVVYDRMTLTLGHLSLISAVEWYDRTDMVTTILHSEYDDNGIAADGTSAVPTRVTGHIANRVASEKGLLLNYAADVCGDALMTGISEGTELATPLAPAIDNEAAFRRALADQDGLDRYTDALHSRFEAMRGLVLERVAELRRWMRLHPW